MEENKYRKFYVDWWNIRKSTIYTLMAVVLVISTLGAGWWWASRNNWFVNTETTDIPKDAARIVSFEGEVRITRASTRETILVTKATWVAAGDTIQTQSDGRAIIQMIDGSRYQMRPNATIVIKDSTTLLGGKNVRVSLDDGQLNVRTGEQPADVKNIVEVADTENRLLSNTDASFDADAQTNGGEIRISRGGVETTIGGEKSTIGENEFASVNGGKLSEREKLLAPPSPVTPANSAQIVDSRNGVSVAFVWQDGDGSPAASYDLQVSRSATFAADAMLVDRSRITSRDFRLAGISPGTYYWRLRATGRSGQTTPWNDAWRFMVVKGGGGGSIEASGWLAERLGGNVYLISGRTGAGMSVRSQGNGTNAGPDGSFRLQISSPSIEATVEIADDRGNLARFVISLRNGRMLRRY